MATARLSRQTSRTLRVGRVGRSGRVPPAARGTGRLEARRTGPIVDTSKLSRTARRRIASPPMAAVDRVGEAVRRAIEAWAEAFIARVMRDIVPGIVRQDATEDDIDAILNALDDPEVARGLLEKAFKSVDKASSDDLRVIGVQTSSVVRNAEQLQAEWLRQSTDLIRATEDVRRRVERILKDPVSEGRSVDDIRGMLIEQAGYAASRAELTARTVTLQTYGKIQEQRQRDAGFTKYVWTTSLDERVREDHAELDGTVQEWDSPPVVDKRSGRRGHPGSDFQCRCSAVPFADPDEVVEPIAAEPELAPPPPPVEVPAPVRVAPPAPPPAEPPVPVVPEVRPPALPDGTPVDIRNLSHEALGADKFREGVLEALRADPAFVSTGKPTAGAARAARTGVDHLRLTLRPDGWYLIDGSHRLQVARELGLDTLPAIVVDASGEEIWRGRIPILPSDPAARAKLMAEEMALVAKREAERASAVPEWRRGMQADIPEPEPHRAPPLVTEPVPEPPVPDAVKRDFFPISENQYDRLLDVGQAEGHQRGSSPEASMVKKFVGPDFQTIRALQQGASIESILADEKTFGFYKRPELEALRDGLPALRRAQDLMSVDNPTRLGPLYRGVNLKPEALADWLASDQIEFKAFSNSTTYDYSTAFDFATARGESGRVILRFEQVDRGAPVGFGTNRNNGELEVIVSDQKFDIVKKTYDPKQDVYVLDLRQAPKTDAKDGPPAPKKRGRDVGRFGSDGSDVRLIKR